MTSSSSNRYCTHEAATHDSSKRYFNCREEIGLHNAVYVCLTSLHILFCGFCGKPAECNIILNVRIKYSALHNPLRSFLKDIEMVQSPVILPALWWFASAPFLERNVQVGSFSLFFFLGSTRQLVELCG